MCTCNLCGRLLSVDGDPLSGDCGGDCWGCIGKIEADLGWQPSVEFVQNEIEERWRADDGTPKPQVFFLTDAEWLERAAAGYKAAFERALHRCRVCGLDHYPEWPWGEDGKDASFDICASCGAEFGYDDETPESCHVARKHWVETKKCAYWGWPTVKPPVYWSPSRQLRWVPPAFRSTDDDRLITLAREHERAGLHLQKRPRLP